MWRVTSVDLSLRHASKPSSPGIFTSRIARSGSSAVAVATAGTPSATSRTVNPERRSMVAMT